MCKNTILPIFGSLTKDCANLVAKKLVCFINQNLSIANITIKSGNGKFFYHFFSIRAFLLKGRSFGDLPGDFAQLAIPLLAESPDERLFEKLIDFQVKLFAFGYRVFAHAPAVIVDAHQSIVKAFHPDGIKSTGNGLYKTRASLSVGTFQGTKATAILIAGEHTVASAYNAGDKIAIDVGISHTLLVDHCLCRSVELGPHFVERILDAHNLIHCHGSSRVAFHTALTFAAFQVTTKFFRYNIGRHQHIANLKNMKFHN